MVTNLLSTLVIISPIYNMVLIIGIDGISGKAQTFQDVCDKAKAIAGSLQDLGVLPGDTIGISCENRLEFAAVMLASIFVGAVFCPIHPLNSSDEIVHILNIIKPCVIFCSAQAYTNVSLSITRLQRVPQVVLFDEILSNMSISIKKYDVMLQHNPIEKLHQSKGDEIAVIVTSSGTTGLSKGVMLSYANWSFMITTARDNRVFDLRTTDVVLGLAPLCHAFGLILFLSSTVIGNTVVLLSKFEERLFLSTIEKYKITLLRLVPLLMVFLGKSTLVRQYDLSSVRAITCSTGPLTLVVAEQVQARLPATDIRQSYGMSETSVNITCTPLHSNKPETVGRLTPGMQAKVIDIKTGKIVKRGHRGEILLRGPSITVGYYNDPAATRQTIDSEGWLHTGDIGYVDNQGFFYLVDRKKELIKYKGYQVAPAELELILLEMPGVKEAVVVGLPDITAGELPIACVVLQPNASLTETSIMDYVNSKVSPQKRLRGVRFIESLPRTQTGKIIRRILRDSIKSKL